ncbi:hypothetical protein [Microbacterium sp. 2FI]|uniref:hypothetical protein n=1 Tax=Microbacterium sp. 2FI TaxID=2502193 RepID=UPI0020182EC6|nr:hypothetical protein [Microbacterium sp. 2FI]
MITMTGAVPTGLLLPVELLATPAFQFLAAFVAINTIMYAALAIAQMLPKVYLSDLVNRRGRRKETRSIHPDERLAE